MADRLTQLQDALDELATQFYASIRYITTHHSPELDPNNNTTTTTTTNNNPNNNNNDAPLSPTEQAQAEAVERQSTSQQHLLDQRELARDLILKEQQIEYLISVLPGIGTSEREQEERLRNLQDALKMAEEERETVRRDIDVVRDGLGGLILSVKRV